MPDIIVTVRVTPKARHRGIKKKDDGTYRVATPKPAEDGKANDDVVDILADFFMVAPSCITLLNGARSRNKIFKIAA